MFALKNSPGQVDANVYHHKRLLNFMSTISRRQFVQGSILAGAFALLPGRVNAASNKITGQPKRLNIGVQLYSVRADCKENFDAALTAVAGMGFTGVEFAGYYNYTDDPAGLRKKLNSLGLSGFSAHLQGGTARLKGDELKKTIDFHKTIGCNYLIVPSDGDFHNPEKYKALAETFNKAAEILTPLGMACGYHNHQPEFKKIDDKSNKTYWDFFAENTLSDVILELDCGWAAYSGQNSAELIKRYPGRTKLTHFKPTVIPKDKTNPSKKAIFGQDSVDWPAALAACRNYGSTEWLIIEQEVYPDGKTPMQATAESLHGLKLIL